MGDGAAERARRRRAPRRRGSTGGRRSRRRTGRPAPGRWSASRWCRAPGRRRRRRSSRVVKVRMGWKDRRVTHADPRPWCARHPRCCSTTTSTAGCARRRSSSWPAECGHELPRRTATRSALGRWFAEAADSGLAGALPRDLRPHRRGDADRGRAAPGGPRVRRGPRRRRRRLRRGALRARAARRDRAVARRRSSPPCRRGSTRASPAAGRPDRRAPAAHRDAPPGPLAARSPSWPSRWRDRGVAGFDIAGAEAGFPPTRHLDAFEYLQRENSHFTIHAGEAFGLPSIWQAIQWCGADRLGHGVRIIDDITVDDDGAVDAGPAGGVRPGQADPARDVPRRPTCRPAPPTRSPSTRSGCSPSCGSGSPSTPTTG